MRIILGLFTALLLAFPVFAEDMTEPQKIEALLDTVDSSGVTIVLNGKEHDGAWARERFEEQMKQRKDINTAQDFITKIANISPDDGKSYYIKLGDGNQFELAKWLQQQLKDFETAETME